MSEYCDIEELEGKTIHAIKRNSFDEEDFIEFICSDGWIYTMYHEQDCTEYVCIEDINGDLDNLIGCRLEQADMRTNSKGGSEEGDSETWTFYNFATIKGYVVIRWYGSSNGYYSEGVDVSKRFDLQTIRNIKLKLVLEDE
jgi:hypothetical protein